MANTLAYYDTATITPIKSFIVQAPGVINFFIKFHSYFDFLFKTVGLSLIKGKKLNVNVGCGKKIE